MLGDDKAASSKLNSDMDAYWSKKDEPAADEEPMKTEEEAKA